MTTAFLKMIVFLFVANSSYGLGPLKVNTDLPVTIEEVIMISIKNDENSLQLMGLAKDYFSNYLIENKRTALTVLDIVKTNGVKKVVNGQNKYNIEYELILQTVKDIYVSDQMSIYTNGFVHKFQYLEKAPTGWDQYQNPDTRKVSSGSRILATGTVYLEETDNGWRVTSFKNSEYKIVGANFETPGMIEAKKEKERQAKLANEKRLNDLISEGDWRQSDIDTLIFKSDFVDAKNIPLFESGGVHLSVSNSISNRAAFRYANLRTIQDKIFASVDELGRYLPSDSLKYSENSNKAQIEFQITEISYKHLGLNNEGKDKGFRCYLKYNTLVKAQLSSPHTLNWNTEIPHSLYSGSAGYYSSKAAAFHEVISRLEREVRFEIIKLEPIYLNIKQAISSKGKKVDAVILENSNGNFFKRGKVVLRVYKKGQINLTNGMLSYGDFVGEIVFKSFNNNGDVTCQPKGMKSKKLLMSLINSESNYIAISI